MKRLIHALAGYPFMALAGTLLWGAVELVALQRAQRVARRRR